MMSRRLAALAVLLATTALASIAKAYPFKEPGSDPATPVAGAPPYGEPARWPERFSPVAPIQRMTFETGMRYWFSSGKYKYDLYDPSGALNVSRLTFDAATAQSAEIYWRADSNRYFLKGNFGGGSVSGGHLNDQDLAPLTVPESNTLSQMKDGSLRYGSIDLGYQILDAGPVGLGVFVGYSHWGERLNSFGCTQVASGPYCSPVGLGSNLNTLNGEPIWNSLRAGLAGSWEMYQGLKLSVDAAYIRGRFSGTDFHVLRPDIDGAPLEGTGNGYMLDAILSYQILKGLDLGVGGRWWHIASDGNLRFDQTLAGAGGAAFSQPVKIEQDRFGVYAQVGYKLGDRSPDAAVPYADINGAGVSWTGLYAGPVIGYGSGVPSGQATTLAPVSGAASSAAAIGVPTSVPVSTGGVLAGVTFGYNWRVGRKVLFGTEADVAYAHIAGANGQTDAGTGVTTSVNQSLGWIGTLRARLGYLLTSDLMVFATGGGAIGGVKTDVVSNQVSTAVPCAATALCSDGTTVKVALGWTAGAGVEFRLNSWATVKAEALYYDLGNVRTQMTDISAGAPANFDATSKFNAGLLRSGINFHW